MDGTLVDSEKLWDVALQELAKEYGGELSVDARQSIIGTAMAESMRILHDDLGQPERDPEISAAWINARILELFRTGLRWRPGAFDAAARGPRGGHPHRAGHLQPSGAGRDRPGHPGSGQLRRGGLPATRWWRPSRTRSRT